MNLGEVLAGVRLKQPLAAELARLELEELEYDSRRVKSGTLFFAFPGARADGRGFAAAAVKAGAVAVVSELPPPEGFRGNWIQVEHGRHALVLDRADGPAIADAVASIWTDRNLYDRLTRGAREFSLRFSWEAAADAVLSLYEQAGRTVW